MYATAPDCERSTGITESHWDTSRAIRWQPAAGERVFYDLKCIFKCTCVNRGVFKWLWRWKCHAWWNHHTKWLWPLVGDDSMLSWGRNQGSKGLCTNGSKLTAETWDELKCSLHGKPSLHLVRYSTAFIRIKRSQPMWNNWNNDSAKGGICMCGAHCRPTILTGPSV